MMQRTRSILCFFLVLSAVGSVLAAEPQAKLTFAFDDAAARVSHLGWDTEGGGRAKRNLLKPNAGVELRFITNQGALPHEKKTLRAEQIEGGGRAYRIEGIDGAGLVWTIQPRAGGLSMLLSSDLDLAPPDLDRLELTFEFDPNVTPTTLLPSHWDLQGGFSLPAVISAPDHGQMVLKEQHGRSIRGRLEGSRRGQRYARCVLIVPWPTQGNPVVLGLSAITLPQPQSIGESKLWPQVRRTWFGALQPTSRWGIEGRGHHPPGILGNNVISDPASVSLWFYGDHIFWIPDLAPGVSATASLRRALDWWLHEQLQPDGQMIGYLQYTGFLDANAGPIIAAWDYVEATGDVAWLKENVHLLERLADYLVERDIDGDGLVEALQSGNRGTLVQPNRSCSWWDAINCGHKDAYSNAVIFRAWCCLAELEKRLGNTARADQYISLARQLKAAYFPEFYNETTGWLGWWRSRDGELHDYASPIVNSLAIEYGLVERDVGRQILKRIRRKMQEAGFERPDLGIPCTLIPVSQDDYLGPDASGRPTQPDGSDTFGQYINGGISPGFALHYMAAHYVVGMDEEADKVLHAMIGRLDHPGFQNGVRGRRGTGIDWTNWQGKPGGYEGYLSDNYRFLQALFLREPANRDRYYRPLRAVLDGKD